MRSGALWVTAMLGAFQLSAAWATGSAGDTRDLWVEVRINSVAQADFALLHVDLRGHLFVRTEALRVWHLRSRGSAEVDDLVRIDDVPGLRVRLDERELVLYLDAEPDLFETQVIAGGARADGAERGVPALLLGYNLFAERASAVGATYSAFAQAGASLGRASLTSSWLGTRVVTPGVAGSAQDGESGWRRLDTDLLVDFPEYTARLTLGDSVTNPDTLGQSVRFMGVHWATDYATRPGVSPYALPAISGTASVPSTVELYVNQALVQRTAVDAGPFELNNIPVPLGQGTVDIRMRDILGQEQRLAVPYLAVPQLLAAGLTSTDFAAGVVREGYGIESFSYGHGFLSGSAWYGVDDNATINGSAEVVPSLHEVTARAGAAVRVARNVLVEFNPAVSCCLQGGGGSRGVGAAVDAGIDAMWSFAAVGVHFRNASPAYAELGNASHLRREWAAQASMQFGRAGSLALVYGWRRAYDMPSSAAATASYNIAWRRVGSLGLFVSSTQGAGGHDVIAGMTFTRYFGRGVTASFTGTSDDGAATVDMRIGQAAPPDAGWGWSLAHARGGVDSDGVRLDVRNAYGMGSGEVDRQPSSGTLGLLAWQGGVLWAAGRAWPAQTLAGPAALVELPELGDVEVLRDGQPAGHTDSAGRILVTGLRPFESNTISVVQEDLPLTALIDSDRLVVRPYSRGIVRAVMGVSATESRLFTLRLERDLRSEGDLRSGGDELVPAGASVSLDGHTFPVGEQGIAQLPVAHAAVEALVTWRGGRCRVRVPALDTLTRAKQGSDGAWLAPCRRE